MTLAQSNAVKARIETVTVLGVPLKTFKSVAPHGTARPYVIIHSADGEDSQERFTGGRTTMHPRFTLHVVGDTADQVETITGALKAKFVQNGFGIPLVIAGESCDGLWWSSPVPLQVDSDPLPQIVYQVIELGWTADPI